MGIKSKYIIGNWKMNMDLNLINSFIEKFNKQTSTINPNHKIGIAPQFIHLPYLLEKFHNTEMMIGAQNCSSYDDGAYTGEVSTQALADLGADFVIIGHSERRKYFNESGDVLKSKVHQALSQHLDIIFCVGETLEQRENGIAKKVVHDQIAEAITDLTSEQLDKVIVAYEPVWAIGTGKTATPDQAEEMHSYIRSILPDASKRSLPILYGGSVKPNNIEELMKKPTIDGALVGGASLKAIDFISLCSVK